MECLRDMAGNDPRKKNDALWVEKLQEGILAFEDSYAALCRAYPDDRETCFFRDLLLVQEEIMLGLYHWAQSCGKARMALAAGNCLGAAGLLRHGAFSLEKLLEDRRKAEHSPFENWYRGDTKMNLPGGLEATYQALKVLKAQ